MSVTYDIGVNLISGFIAAGVSTATIWVVTRSKRVLFARRLWRLNNPRSLAVIVSTSTFERPGLQSPRLGTGVGQLRAIATLSPSLVRAYRNDVSPDMVVLSDELEAAHHLGDLILLGGPRSNRVTEEVFAQHPDLRVYMANALRADGSGPHDSRVHWVRDDGTIEIFDTADEGPYVYGMVSRTRNVLDLPSGGKLWVIAGSSTYGTQAAAQWLADNQRYARRNKSDIALVIRAQKPVGLAGHISTPELYRPDPS